MGVPGQKIRLNDGEDYTIETNVTTSSPGIHYNVSRKNDDHREIMSADSLRRLEAVVIDSETRRLAALDPAPSVAMDVLPMFLSFLFLLILGRIAHAFWRRSRDEDDPKRTRPMPREAAISGLPD